VSSGRRESAPAATEPDPGGTKCLEAIGRETERERQDMGAEIDPNSRVAGGQDSFLGK